MWVTPNSSFVFAQWEDPSMCVKQVPLSCPVRSCSVDHCLFAKLSATCRRTFGDSSIVLVAAILQIANVKPRSVFAMID